VSLIWASNIFIGLTTFFDRDWKLKGQTNPHNFLVGNRKISIFFCRLVLITFTLLVFPNVCNAKYASFVIDSVSGQVRHSVNENTRNYPASLTKLMTLYLLFEAIEKKKFNLNSQLKVSYRASNQPASRLGLKRGQTITVQEAILALIIKSANDVATVVAEALGGNERRFALLMTAKARKLGMSRTIFRNASGLSHRGQMSTAKDMAKLTLHLINQYPKYYHYFSKKVFTFRGKRYRTHNKVLRYFPGAEGMKTGYIRASGFNLITTTKRNGHRLVGVIFGGNTARARDRHMKNLLNRAYAKVQTEKLLDISNKTKRANENSRALAPRGGKTDPSTKSIWGIQIGAFYTRKPAMKLAKSLFRKHANLLNDGQISIMPIRKSRNRTLYRARILGIGMRTAYRACRILKRQQQACMPLRLPKTIQIASR
jgi:D-alanyl-D-alanine carboxypeptidase